ncbi:MAG: rhomboid family intramembrane serine protease [Pseudonocardiaceae bacterium]
MKLPGRVPAVTAVVFGVTATTSVLQFVFPAMLVALRRDPQGLHGEWWRTFTALFVQDGGPVGTISNLAFLLVIGTLAEQVLSTRRWLICYFGAGVAGELAGYVWQPQGAGNSVGICGLAGALIVALLLSDERMPRVAPMFLMYWCGALLGLLFWPGIVLGVAGAVLAQIAGGRGLPVGRPVAMAAAVVAAVLLAARDIHGAALVAGMAIAALIARADRPDPYAVGVRPPEPSS